MDGKDNILCMMQEVRLKFELLQILVFLAMGKSPGKWIKTVLFGKKSSKSHTSKGREVNMKL